MTPANCDGASVPGPRRSLRVLVAEDNEVNGALAVRLLNKRGHDAVVVGTGRDAVEAWEGGGFDLILMDLQMPQMDGFAATAAIRGREKGTTRYTPIIALTANTASADEARCREAGMDAFISKPVRVDAFYAVIASVLARTGTISPQRLASDSETPEVFELSSALETVDGERDLLLGMIAIFMSQTPRVVQDLDAAIAAGDACAVEAAAHKLKGSVAMFGARRAREAAQHLEDLASAGELAPVGRARRTLGEEIDRLRGALEAVAAENSR